MADCASGTWPWRRERPGSGVFRLLVLALGMQSLQGCSGLEVVPPSGPTATQAPLVATYTGNYLGGDGAGLKGHITVESGCLLVEVEEPGAEAVTVLPIFPAASIAQSPGALSFRGDVLRDSDLIELGGGFRGVQDLSWASVPDACQPSASPGIERVFQVADE